MGYNAFVKCNCYRDGKLSSNPPFDKYIKENEEGIWLDLDWETNQEKHEEFERWKYSKPCEHPNMEVCSERLANISGMAAFRTIIYELGTHKYPILSQYLPEVNGGHLPFEKAEEMKLELERLGNETSSEKLVVLKELLSNKRVQSVNAKYSHTFAFAANNKYNYTLSVKGFQIVKNSRLFGKEFSKLIFLSSQFKQKKIAENKYLLIDSKSNKTFSSALNIYPDKEYDEELDFIVEIINASIADEYSYIIEPLRKLTIASLETGNSIVWC